uniref:F-box domain-containing protein n=1 Tax=Davidia involucrata TaxID=16924 RepID=A0A5B6ZXE1_DAVIN
MALGKMCGSNVNGPNEGLGLGFVRYTRSFSFGRKRVIISNNIDVNAPATTPTKKQCSEILHSGKSLLEALPQDILIRILCGVNHDDLKQLFHVSKLIREATLIAKQWHFAYSTPTKTSAFRNSIDLEDSSEFNEVEAPNAPMQLRRYRSRVSGKKLADISVALFAAPDEEQCPRKELFMEMET